MIWAHEARLPKLPQLEFHCAPGEWYCITARREFTAMLPTLRHRGILKHLVQSTRSDIPCKVKQIINHHAMKTSGEVEVHYKDWTIQAPAILCILQHVNLQMLYMIYLFIYGLLNDNVSSSKYYPMIPLKWLFCKLINYSKNGFSALPITICFVWKLSDFTSITQKRINNTTKNYERFVVFTVNLQFRFT